jgi:SpoVK/Ycf46/Vps4 family AAA+-type ATPase
LIIYHIQNNYENDYLHTIITGPPGVGKTEFAKIYAEIFVRLGILKSDKFIEIKRDDLVGEFLGQTSIKTRKLLESAMGGVLFLDEAYSLGNEEKRDFYSKEAIDMLNQYLSEKKDQFMFIIAGYEEEIESCLLSYNRGMKRRFHTYYNIDGYTACELKNIFIQKIKKSFVLNIPDNTLTEFFCNNKVSFKNYGGDIEKLITEIKHIQALRTFNININNKEIIIDDVQNAFNNLFNTNKKEVYNYNMYS